MFRKPFTNASDLEQNRETKTYQKYQEVQKCRHDFFVPQTNVSDIIEQGCLNLKPKSTKKYKRYLIALEMLTFLFKWHRAFIPIFSYTAIPLSNDMIQSFGKVVMTEYLDIKWNLLCANAVCQQLWTKNETTQRKGLF